jgi:hypothetical protein
MADNPIKYSDFIQPDGSVSDLIKQLEQVQTTYGKMKDDIIASAKAIEQAMKMVNNTSSEGQEKTKKMAGETDRLAKAYNDLAFAESETARELARVRMAMADANNMNKLFHKRGEEEVNLTNLKQKSYEQLSAQYSINKNLLNKMTAEYRANSKEGRELESTTKEIYEEMKRLQSATGMNQLNVGNYPDMTEALGGYTDKLKEAMGLNNSFANSIITMSQSGGGFKNLLGSIGTSVKALGATLMTLMANPVFLAIAGVAAAGAAFKFWFDYNKGLVEATKLTNQFTGKTGNDLKNYRNEIQALSDMYDKDFRESLMAVNAVSKQFGISQDEALKLVKDGFIAGADANGEFLDNLKEYPAYFKEAGISASQFIAITTQANKSGIYSDKGIDAIKEGNLRIREMTVATAAALDGIGMNSDQVQKDLQSGAKTTFQVMQEVSAKLNELPENSKAVGTAIADIFGGPGEDAGLQYLKTLKDIDTNLDSVKDKAGKLGQLQEEQMRSQVELTNTISALFDATGGTFEEMTTRAKTFLNDALIGIIKGLISLINYFIKLYNDSILFRGVIQAIVTDWNILWNTVKSVFTYMIDQIKVIGKALHGAFTLDFDEIKQAYQDWGNNTLKLTKGIVNGTVDEVKKGAARMQKQIQPITIPMSIEGGETTTTKTDGGTKTPPKSPANKVTGKDLEAIRKQNLDLVRKYEDAQIVLEKDEFEKRRKQTTANYTRQIEDLRYQLENEKKLTAEGKAAIRGTIQALEQQQTRDLLQIEQERRTQELNLQKASIQLKLDAAQKGSLEELKLREDMIEKEKQLALLENSKKPEGQKQDAEDIKKKFDAQRQAIDAEYQQLAMLQFDYQQALAASEFDLLRTTEGEKTRFRLEQEKERLKKILELNKTAANKLSDVEIATIQNTIKKIDQEISASSREDKDIYSMIGLNLDDDQKAAIEESTSFAIGQLQNFLQAKIDAAQAAVDAANVEVDASQKKLDAEIEARNQGYASNVTMAQKELELAKKNQEKALKEQEKAQKAQKAIDTLQQVSSLVTATAGIWKSFAGTGPWGVALAIAGTALMWGSFAAAKIKASQLTKKEYGEGGLEFLQGGSHASGNDIPLGYTKDGKDRRAEGGEALAIIRKSQARKYRHILPGIISALNKGTFEQKYMGAYETGGLSIGLMNSPSDLKTLENDVRAIKKQGERRYFTDGKGRIIETYKNLRRIYNAN